MGINSEHHIIGLDTISRTYCTKDNSLTKETNWNTAHVVKEGINWLDIARMVRVGHGVNKIIVLSYKKKWLSIEWIKP